MLVLMTGVSQMSSDYSIVHTVFPSFVLEAEVYIRPLSPLSLCLSLLQSVRRIIQSPSGAIAFAIRIERAHFVVVRK